MYRMYVDETGSADPCLSDKVNSRYLGLTGIVISLPDVHHIATPLLNSIKHDIFDRGDPDTPVVLHRKELMQKRPPFYILTKPEKEAEFNSRILDLMRSLDFVAITAVIDKWAHIQRYQVWQQDPYHYCMEILYERYCLYLKSKNSQGDIMAEARGKNEDKRLKECVLNFYQNGTGFVKKDVIHAHITSKNLKVEQKYKNITGLQIADLIAHPSCLHARKVYNKEVFTNDFGSVICELLADSKYYRHQNGKINGYGLKWLP